MLILIDGNAMAHAHHNATTLNCGDLQTQAIYGFTRMVRDMKFAYPDSTLVVLWDGHAQHRYDAYPEYKSNRSVEGDPVAEKHRAALQEQKPYIKGMLKTAGIRQITALNLEADDLAGYFVRSLPNKRILLVTGDGDWLQLVGPNVTWLDPRNDGKKVTHETFLDSTGYFTPQEFLQGKALQGDTSDAISGVGGIGKDTAPKFLAEWRSVYKFFEAVDNGTYKPKERKDKKAKTLHPEQLLASPEGRARFERNMNLMNLIDAPTPDPNMVRYVEASFDEDVLRKLCERLGFMSLTRDWDNFVRPFKN